jgi:predicted SnoaL-like aldol condensation-catalyzing enzyme
MITTHQRAGWNVAAGMSVFFVAAIAASPQRPTRDGGTLSIEHNRAAVLRWSQELWGQGHLAVADEIIAPGYVRHDPGDPFPARGPEDVKRIVAMLRTMLPDFRIQVEAVIAEGDLVVSRYTATATDTAGYMGMPPTAKRFEP